MLVVGDDAGREVVLHAVDELEHLGELALLVRGDHLEGADELGGGAAYYGETYYGSGVTYLLRLYLLRQVAWKGPKSSVVAASKASSLPRIVSIGR